MQSEMNDRTARELSEASCETSQKEMHSRIFMALQIAEKRGQVLASYRQDNPKYSHPLSTSEGERKGISNGQD